jgi:methylated-DNA-[protein]-cysteine S-methyltransferase
MAVRTVAYEIPGWGVGEVVLRGDLLLYHELPHAGLAARDLPREPGHPLVARIERYFAGERVSFDDVQLDLEWCTPFQRAVAEAMRAVPWGETVTYGELAALAGYPNAQRAAGSFCAGNRFGLVLPCHRVVAAGALGSYGELGVEYKRRLLALEGVHLDSRAPAAR